MALRRFSDNPAAGALTGTEIVPGIQGGIDVQMTSQDIADLASGGGRNTVTALGTSGAQAMDFSLGDYFSISLTGNATLSITNPPTSGGSLILEVVQDATPRTLGWPASFIWAGGTPGSISTGSGDKDLIGATTLDGGTTWYATIQNAFA